MERDILQDLLAKLTLKEKVSLLSGADGWQTQEISRLVIGSLKTTDGPAGARGALSIDGPTAAFLPAPVAQAATWSKEHLYEIGKLLCKEAKTKSAQVLLAPTICCARNPLGGRNFESYSEDPYLSGTLATEYIRGVQETGEVVATVKHFVANEQEYERFPINSEIEERVLREIYLKPFEMAIKSPNPPKCVMTAYNCVNGTYIDMNSLLQKTLRDEWGFKGLVMSDWGGTNSTVESVLTGCDLEMPGPPEKRGRLLLKHIAENDSTALLEAINASCLRMLGLLKDLNLLGLSREEAVQTRKQPELSSDTAEDRRLLRSVAADSIVLLKNSANMLPLLPSKLQGKKIALISPNAKHGTPGGGGSATMNPQYQTQPLEALRSMLETKGIRADFIYSPGALTHKWLPLVTSDKWSSPPYTKLEGKEQGLLELKYYSTPNFFGEVIDTQHRSSSHVDLPESALVLTSNFTPSTTGLHTFEISSVGNSRLFVDGQLLIDNSEWSETGETFYSFGSVAVRASLSMIAGQKYRVKLEAWTKLIGKEGTKDDDPVHVFGVQPSVRLGFMEETKSEEELISDAVEAAKEADIVICVLGLNDEWESEGYDRKSMGLPGAQDELVWRLLKECGNREKVIVVNQSGSPVHMPWAEEVSTIVQAWYGGQEAGNALWDVLTGGVNPNGRLPVSWPKEYHDLGFKKHNWPGVNGIVKYEEGINVGYHLFQNKGLEPRWWFGHGLSYTAF